MHFLRLRDITVYEDSGIHIVVCPVACAHRLVSWVGADDLAQHIVLDAEQVE